ncbi:uncharacterized protein LOC141902522 [Tubulanus polymorphus]|uniref:uncharacterized protein LOC141902522 n=1 Tax=Tubulanus polymorphus TaxID=672921 RepID=UPI003DA5B0C8
MDDFEVDLFSGGESLFDEIQKLCDTTILAIDNLRDNQTPPCDSFESSFVEKPCGEFREIKVKVGDSSADDVTTSRSNVNVVSDSDYSTGHRKVPVTVLTDHPTSSMATAVPVVVVKPEVITPSSEFLTNVRVTKTPVVNFTGVTNLQRVRPDSNYVSSEEVAIVSNPESNVNDNSARISPLKTKDYSSETDNNTGSSARFIDSNSELKADNKMSHDKPQKFQAPKIRFSAIKYRPVESAITTDKSDENVSVSSAAKPRAYEKKKPICIGSAQPSDSTSKPQAQLVLSDQVIKTEKTSHKKGFLDIFRKDKTKSKSEASGGDDSKSSKQTENKLEANPKKISACAVLESSPKPSIIGVNSEVQNNSAQVFEAKRPVEIVKTDSADQLPTRLVCNHNPVTVLNSTAVIDSDINESENRSPKPRPKQRAYGKKKPVQFETGKSENYSPQTKSECVMDTPESLSSTREKGPVHEVESPNEQFQLDPGTSSSSAKTSIKDTTHVSKERPSIFVDESKKINDAKQEDCGKTKSIPIDTDKSPSTGRKSPPTETKELQAKEEAYVSVDETLRTNSTTPKDNEKKTPIQLDPKKSPSLSSKPMKDISSDPVREKALVLVDETGVNPIAYEKKTPIQLDTDKSPSAVRISSPKKLTESIEVSENTQEVFNSAGYTEAKPKDYRNEKPIELDTNEISLKIAEKTALVENSAEKSELSDGNQSKDLMIGKVINPYVSNDNAVTNECAIKESTKKDKSNDDDHSTSDTVQPNVEAKNVGDKCSYHTENLQLCQMKEIHQLEGTTEDAHISLSGSKTTDSSNSTSNDLAKNVSKIPEVINAKEPLAAAAATGGGVISSTTWDNDDQVESTTCAGASVENKSYIYHQGFLADRKNVKWAEDQLGFNSVEIKEFLDAFSVFDKNSDGVITLEELGAVMTSLGQSPTRSELQGYIEDIDTDNSGTIDFNEFLVMMNKKMHTDQEAEMYNVFRVFDKNKDGKISVDELYGVLVKLGENITYDEAKEMIDEADTDRDGFVNYTEFKAILCAQ